MVAFVKVTFFRSTLQGALSHRKPTSAGIFRDSCSRVILNGKTKAFGKKKKKLCRCHFDHLKFHMGWFGTDPVPSR